MLFFLATLLAIAAAQEDVSGGSANKPLTRLEVVPSACTTTTVTVPREETSRKRDLNISQQLVCGQNTPCGSASITVAGNQVTVTLNSAADWTIGHTHLYVGPGWPTAWNSTAPPPGSFPIQQASPVLPFTRTFTVGQGLLANACGAGAAGGQVAIAIHTESKQRGGSEETGWVKGNQAFGGSRWGWYNSICVPCTPQETTSGNGETQAAPAGTTASQPSPKGGNKTPTAQEEVAPETNKGKNAENAFKPAEVVPVDKCTYGDVVAPREEASDVTPPAAARKRALSVSSDILCGQKTKCGTSVITVGDDGTVSVTINEFDGWNINHVHVFAAPGWPLEWATKAPPPGQFPVNEAFPTTGSSVTKTFKIGEGVLANVCGAALATGGQLVIAIHTESAPTAGGSSETGWSKGNQEFGGSRWGWFHRICVPCQNTPPVDVSDAALQAAVAVPDPVAGATTKKVNEFKATAKTTPPGKSVSLSAKVNSVTAKTPRAVDQTVRVLQATLDQKLGPNAKATVSKGEDGEIKVRVDSTDGTTVSDEVRDQAASIVASFAVVEQVQGEEPVDRPAAASASAVALAATVAALAVTLAL